MTTQEDKKEQFVADLRQWMSDYKELIQRVRSLTNAWPLYQAILVEDDLSDAIIPSGDPITKLSSLTDSVANMIGAQTVFDAGVDDNYERCL